MSEPVPHRSNLIVLTLLCLVLYLPGLTSIPPIDRDEARFAESTRQMIETGDFVRPRFQGADRFRKPIGIYWLQALSVSLTGADRDRIWAYRLPSAVAGIGTVLLTYHFGAMWYAAGVALAGAALLATSILMVIETHLATTDATLLFLIVAAQGCLAVLYAQARRGRRGPLRYALGFWIAQGLAILIKGPVAPLISGLTIVTIVGADAWTGQSRFLGVEGRPPYRPALVGNLRWRWGVPLVLMIVFPWTIAIARDTDGAFVRQWWQQDILPKLIGGHESHGAPPGMYLLMLGATFWPGSMALVSALTRARTRNWRAQERFLLAWLVPAWLVFEMMPTKLPHYVLPLFPPLALLCARAALSARPIGTSMWMRASLIVWLGVGLSAATALALAPALLESTVTVASIASAGLLGAAVLAAGRLGFSTRWRAALAVACAASAVLSVTALGFVLPRADALWLSQRAAAAIRRSSAAHHVPVAAAGYAEPSLVFLAGENVRLVEPQTLATFMHQQTDALGLITESVRAEFDAAATRLGFATRVLWSGDGLKAI